MAEIIHHEESSSNSLLVIIIIVILAVAGFLVWRLWPGTAAIPPADSQPSASINITLPPGNASGT